MGMTPDLPMVMLACTRIGIFSTRFECSFNIFPTRFECSFKSSPLVSSVVSGAVHSVVFGGFSATALKDRIIDAHSEIVICGDWGLRGKNL